MPRRLHGSGFWKRRAKLQLKLEPLCRMCAAEGRITAATCADHITPHHNDPNAFILGELQSLCDCCHNSRKKFQEKHGYDKAVGLDGFPLDPRHPIYQQSE